MVWTSLSLSNITHELENSIPPAYLVLVLAVILLPKLPVVGNILLRLGGPLQQFLTVYDLSEYDALNMKLAPPTWKNLCLVALAAAHTAGWSSAAAYQAIVKDLHWAALANLGLWVRRLGQSCYATNGRTDRRPHSLS